MLGLIGFSAFVLEALLATQLLTPSPTDRFQPTRQVVDAVQWARWSDADVLLLAPEAFLDALEPWVAHREKQGHRIAVLTAERLGGAALGAEGSDTTGFVAALRQHARGLRYVFVVSDTPGRAAERTTAAVLSETRPKLDYWGDGWLHHQAFPSDDTLAVAGMTDGAVPDRPLAVGRLPADTVDEVRGYVAKLLRYESGKASGEWRRRAVVFTGPARYGAVADALIETTAQHVLDNVLPYDWDLRFTFGFPEHAYAVAPPDLGAKLVRDLSGGALIAGYVGHGLEHAFDHIAFRGEHYSIGSVEDVNRVHIEEGHPFFIALTCLTGAFDRGEEHGLAEALVLNPHGAIAAFAATRTVHPYANGLLAQALAQVFFVGERPKTLGDGLLDVRRRAPGHRVPLLEMAYGFDVGVLLEEHKSLYHLLGDPLVRLQYPQRLELTGSTPTVAPGAPFAVDVPAGAGAQLVITVETQRSTIRGRVAPWAELVDLPLDALRSAMAERYEAVMDKVVSRSTEMVVEGVSARLALTAPSAPGRYAVKVYATGKDGAAAGSWRFEVKAP